MSSSYGTTDNQLFEATSVSVKKTLASRFQLRKFPIRQTRDLDIDRCSSASTSMLVNGHEANTLFAALSQGDETQALNVIQNNPTVLGQMWLSKLCLHTDLQTFLCSDFSHPTKMNAEWFQQIVGQVIVTLCNLLRQGRLNMSQLPFANVYLFPNTTYTQEDFDSIQDLWFPWHIYLTDPI